MKVNTCPICNTAITEDNDTNEHVIPNSIGGRKKVSGFICRSCNTESGLKWDKELANQLNWLSLLFGIKRDRGAPPGLIFDTVSGEKVILNADGTKQHVKPTYSETQTENGVQIHISAPTTKKAKKMVIGFERKYSHFPKKTSEFKAKKNYSDDPILFQSQIGGLRTGRSLTKTALAVVHDAEIPLSSCEEAINYLTDDSAEACFGYLYSFDPIQNRPKGIPLHCVYVNGDPDTGLILGYIEYFGHHRMALCLSKSYIGPIFENSYSINPMNGSKLDLKFELPLSLEDINDCYEYKLIPEGSIERTLDNILPTAIELSEQLELKRTVEEAKKYAFENCRAKKGEILNEDHKLAFSRLFTEKMMPYFTHKMRNGSNRGSGRPNRLK